MNTFLPYPDFARSVACLDNKRLGKQRSEVLVLLRGGWPHHPASRMWRGYQECLAIYGLHVCAEWQRRGCRDATYWRIEPYAADSALYPPWLGREDFHASHRANLLRKDPVHYGQFGWTEQPAKGYIWPRTSPADGA